MVHARAVIAGNPRLFGRGPVRISQSVAERGWTVSNDLKLFAATFAAGFLFVSILIA